MTTRYVGKGGSDANSGLSWALRKLTLNGAEDTPVVAGDNVYVGPGVYRELLTVDVSGTSGNIITYIGDVTGENTDGIGGVVRITGSDNDQTAARNNCVDGNAKDFRTFRGFSLDVVSAQLFIVTNGTDWIWEDCFFQNSASNNAAVFFQTDCSNITIRRCVFLGGGSGGGRTLQFYDAATERANKNILIENCIFDASDEVIHTTRYSGITIKNCLIINAFVAVRVANAITTGTVDVNNCIISSCQNGLFAAASGDLVEDYNAFYANGTDRSNVSVGSNSNTYPPLFTPPILADGFVVPLQFGQLSQWSQVARIAGTGEAADDLFGITRPATSAKKSWGAIQLREATRETGTKRTGDASLALADAGDHAIRMPVDGTEITIDAYTYFEADYAGTKPQMIIRQAGQTDDTTLATGAVDTWEKLSTTLTPAAGWVDVIFRSNNTATSGSYATFWDDLAVS